MTGYHHWINSLAHDLYHLSINHMHMTSQKGAHLRWGQTRHCQKCASSPSMQPGGKPLHASPPGWPARARALKGWVPMRTASTTRVRCATLVWRCCYVDVTSMHKVYKQCKTKLFLPGLGKRCLLYQISLYGVSTVCVFSDLHLLHIDKTAKQSHCLIININNSNQHSRISYIH